MAVLTVDRTAHATDWRLRLSSVNQSSPSKMVQRSMSAIVRWTRSAIELARGFLTVVGWASIP